MRFARAPRNPLMGLRGFLSWGYEWLRGFQNETENTVVMARYTRKILAELDDQGKELLIGDMYEEISPPPHTHFSYENSNTHRMIKLTSNQIKAKFESSIDTIITLDLMDSSVRNASLRTFRIGG